jgi:hypothetical protein
MSPIWTNRSLAGWVVLDFKEKYWFFLSNPNGWIAKTNSIWPVYTPSQWLPLCYNKIWKVMILLYNLYASIMQLSDLPEIDCLLITQSLDDHCHLKTLNPFSQKFPNTRVIATPNAKSLLDPLFKNVSIYVLSIFSLPHCCWKLFLCTLCIWIWMMQWSCVFWYIQFDPCQIENFILTYLVYIVCWYMKHGWGFLNDARMYPDNV